MQHRHLVRDARREFQWIEPRRHHGHHRTGRTGQREDAGHLRLPKEELHDERETGRKPGRGRDGLEHVGIGPAIRDVPTQHDGGRLPGEAQHEDEHAGPKRSSPVIDQPHQKQCDAEEVDDPDPGQMAPLEVETLPLQSACRRIELGIGGTK